MKTSENGLNIIKQFEGCRLEAYLCPAMVLTIGYGHTGPEVFKGQTITQERANELLVNDVSRFEKKINDLNILFNQNQFDAVVSLCFNIGFGNFLVSTLKKKALINVNDSSIGAEFMKWNKAKVKGILTPLSGLTKRRKAESDLYFKPI